MFATMEELLTVFSPCSPKELCVTNLDFEILREIVKKRGVVGSTCEYTVQFSFAKATIRCVEDTVKDTAA
jgi:hypothetical protein